jgi:hypothetical protein
MYRIPQTPRLPKMPQYNFKKSPKEKGRKSSTDLETENQKALVIRVMPGPILSPHMFHFVRIRKRLSFSPLADARRKKKTRKKVQPIAHHEPSCDMQ